MHPITLLSRLPYHNDTAEWAQLTDTERRTLDNARDVVCLGGRLDVEEYNVLLAVYRRLHGNGPLATHSMEES